MNVRFAQKAIILEDRKLLLVKKSDEDPLSPGRWELPGGRLEQGESLDDALRREVREEVGLTISPGRLVSMWDWEMPTGSTTTRVVAVARLCALESGELDRGNNKDGDFLADARWVPLHSVFDLPLITDQETTIKEIQNLTG